MLVDVTNSNGKPRLDMVANFYSDAVHFTERFTPLGSDELDYEVTVEDTHAYTHAWKLAATKASTAPTK